ncbi:MAG: hypothetical protein HFI72_05410 [Peptococcaceae bacterium]|nr:hypothetical protein [Peptococcaceae bacterium]
MKKFFLIVFCIVGGFVVFFLSLFALMGGYFLVYDISHPDSVIASLPKPISEAYYCSDGFQDYTIYEKRCYSEEVLSHLENNPCLKKMETSDILEISHYVDDFERWVKHTDYFPAYDFNVECLSETDYFYIVDKCSEPPHPRTGFQYEKYENYDVYIFDTESLILYMLHNNI